MTENVSDPGAIFLFAILSLLVLIIAWKRAFFSYSFDAKSWLVPIQWYHVVTGFAVYFIAALFVSPFFGSFLKHNFFPGMTLSDRIGFASWLNFFNSFIILLLIILFILFLPLEVRKAIWRRQGEEKRPYSDDISFAAFAWLVSFPLVLFLSQFLDWVVTFIFRVKMIPEQLAVHFLKMTFGYPLYFSLTLATIIIFAPLIEETLFRGFLQTFIRRHLGSKQAIGITSALFSLFHYSPEQGLGNIPIVGALFALALFLGFVYEKKGSLLAPISLHAFFNLISVLNLYFLGGFPKGPL